ncbi:AraC family transcriptional regulator [Ruegeria atlantica]|uniref:AraC family transcriptional regulator n=1 Tax=Ruegeria atlantica TaxID=81569 RepID=UPI0024945F79|nr:AraC family transcriptional regulator [Ruegeria atlantica]
MIPNKNERFLHICKHVEAELGNAVYSRLLAGVGLVPNRVSEMQVSAMQEATLLRNSCQAADDITLAARIGIAFRQASTLTAYIARSSATLRQAIENGARFYSLSDDSTEFILKQDSGSEVMEVVTSEGALMRHHRFQEFRVFGLLARLRAIAGAEFYPKELCLRHEGGVDANSYEKIANCPVRFAGPFNGIRFRSGALDRSLPGYDQDLVAYLNELGAERLRKVGKVKQSFRAQVEALMIGRLPGRILTANEIASELGMSRRTLTRHLTQEGAGFRQLVDELRFDLAKTYLRDGLNISEIAFILGYGDHAAFSTAFRRWAGRSPSAFQKNR